MPRQSSTSPSNARCSYVACSQSIQVAHPRVSWITGGAHDTARPPPSVTSSPESSSKSSSRNNEEQTASYAAIGWGHRLSKGKLCKPDQRISTYSGLSHDSASHSTTEGMMYAAQSGLDRIIPMISKNRFGDRRINVGENVTKPPLCHILRSCHCEGYRSIDGPNEYTIVR